MLTSVPHTPEMFTAIDQLEVDDLSHTFEQHFIVIDIRDGYVLDLELLGLLASAVSREDESHLGVIHGFHGLSPSHLCTMQRRSTKIESVWRWLCISALVSIYQELSVTEGCTVTWRK